MSNYNFDIKVIVVKCQIRKSQKLVRFLLNLMHDIKLFNVAQM